jgi:hypothetical protein
MKIARAVNPAHVRRAQKVPSAEVPGFLDSTVVALHQALDHWRYHNGPEEEVDLAIDAFLALWISKPKM